MNKNSKYTDKPDFKQLGELYPSFKAFLKTKKNGAMSLDWKDPDAIRELTTTLLHHDYNILFEMPKDQLCPAVTNRTSYIHWINDLLTNFGENLQSDQVHGIDIGTGGSCIYPLLGHAIYNWNFLATDISEDSLNYANKNITLNNWQDFINTQHVPSSNLILNGVLELDKNYDFCMCNPPFFEEVEQKIEHHSRICEATPGELATDGGELKFITQILEDSLILKNQIYWYTTMIGRKVDYKKFLIILRKNNIVNIRTTTFFHGKTTRWAIAWTFQNDKPKISKILPSNTSKFSVNLDLMELKSQVEFFFQNNGIKFTYDKFTVSFRGTFFEEFLLSQTKSLESSTDFKKTSNFGLENKSEDSNYNLEIPIHILEKIKNNTVIEEKEKIPEMEQNLISKNSTEKENNKEINILDIPPSKKRKLNPDNNSNSPDLFAEFTLQLLNISKDKNLVDFKFQTGSKESFKKLTDSLCDTLLNS